MKTPKDLTMSKDELVSHLREVADKIEKEDSTDGWFEYSILGENKYIAKSIVKIGESVITLGDIE